MDCFGDFYCRICGDLFEGDFLLWGLGPLSVEELFSRIFVGHGFSRNFCGELFSVKCFFWQIIFGPWGILLLGINIMGEVFLKFSVLWNIIGELLGEFPMRKAI